MEGDSLKEIREEYFNNYPSLSHKKTPDFVEGFCSVSLKINHLRFLDEYEPRVLQSLPMLQCLGSLHSWLPQEQAESE